eukprot:SAG31_NODE_7904_length_1569_cov_1.102721_1_plen_135_part_00
MAPFLAQAKGRYNVAVESGGGSKVLAVRPANVRLLEPGIGAEVEVRGLKGAPEHNGKRGKVIANKDPKSGRFAVELEVESSDAKKTLGLKLENLELAEKAAAAATSTAETASNVEGKVVGDAASQGEAGNEGGS